MGYLRTGTCNRCGECCGFPRATDGGQNNPWPLSWPQSLRSWSIESLDLHLPVIKFTGHPNLGGKQSGSFKVGGNTIRWCWANEGGIATDVAPYNDGGATFNRRCPLLLDGAGDHPCAAYGQTQLVPGSTLTLHQMWEQLCKDTPPLRLDDQSQVDNWFTNCPSCSYVYVQE